MPQGYPDPLTRESLAAALGARASELTLQVHPLIDSTNAEAKRLATAELSKPVLIVAEAQTAGRGRMGRSFFSPADTGVYFSLLWETDADPRDAVTVTGAAAVAVMRAIRARTGIAVSIKWVNDLYLGSRKICGILAESVLCAGQKPRLILGVGVNLSTEDFPTELADIAGSLGAKELSRADLIAAIVGELEPFLCDPTDRSWLPDYKAASMVLGNAVRWSEHGKCEEGVAVDVDDCGGLVVRTASGEEKTLASGEISLRLG